MSSTPLPKGKIVLPTPLSHRYNPLCPKEHIDKEKLMSEHTSANQLFFRGTEVKNNFPKNINGGGGVRFGHDECQNGTPAAGRDMGRRIRFEGP